MRVTVPTVLNGGHTAGDVLSRGGMAATTPQANGYGRQHGLRSRRTSRRLSDDHQRPADDGVVTRSHDADGVLPVAASNGRAGKEPDLFPTTATHTTAVGSATNCGTIISNGPPPANHEPSSSWSTRRAEQKARGGGGGGGGGNGAGVRGAKPRYFDPRRPRGLLGGKQRKAHDLVTTVCMFVLVPTALVILLVYLVMLCRYYSCVRGALTLAGGALRALVWPFRPISLVTELSGRVWSVPAILGALVTAYYFVIFYFNSDVPGIRPPLPRFGWTTGIRADPNYSFGLLLGLVCLMIYSVPELLLFHSSRIYGDGA